MSYTNGSNIYKTIMAAVICLVLAMTGYAATAEKGKPLVLQEMSWLDVQNYLKTNDMVIIPLGSTEQHGPHMPLGTDFYEALEVSKKISAQTGVVVAPVLMAGYSVYHSGFPGTLSLKPETMAQVLFETAEMLIKYGFRRFMFFNFHGGNRLAESIVIHKINHTTEAAAVKLGIGSASQKGLPEAAPLDYHAGVGETSIMLYLKPELVKMERAKKPTMTLTPKMKQLQKLVKENPGMGDVVSGYLGVPVETKKNGASHQLSSNGIWTLGDPKTASRERGEKDVNQRVANAVKFIKTWEKAH
ncbi:MAG: creatininase family protein [bacterium]|nr:creatininase family protein [bacterium]